MSLTICSSVQSLSWVQLFATPWTAAGQAFLLIINSRSLLKLMSIELAMPSNHVILCLPLLLPYIPLLLPPSIFPSIRVFSDELVLRIRWPKYWSFNMDWLDLLAVQGTLKSLLPTPQFFWSFLSINSSVLSFLYSPTLTIILDHRKNNSLN